MLVQVKQIGWVFTEFITKIREEVGLYNGREGGNSKLWMKMNNYKRPNEITILLKRSNTGYMNSEGMMRVWDVQNGWV